MLAALAILLFATGYLIVGSRDQNRGAEPSDSLQQKSELGANALAEIAGAKVARPSEPSNQKPQEDIDSSAAESAAGGTESEAPAAQSADPWRSGPLPPGRGVRLALVIDDLGRSLEDLDALDALGVPITHAVLPFESKTPEVVAEIRRRGHELICHLPMEPSTGADPGPGALRGFMSRSQLERATRDALAAVPGASGANNHMGSRLTVDRAKMRAVLGVLAERDLFFLDSRTSAQSVGYQQAIALGIPAAERQVFLDGDPDRQAIRRQFARWLELAGERGAAIAIGHPHPYTLAVLAEEIPRALAAGYEFVPVSYLLDSAGGFDP